MSREASSPERGSKGHEVYRFRLFIAGNEVNSEMARATLFRLAETYLPGRHEIVVVDVMQDYEAALKYGVIAVPTLLIEGPVERVIVGSLRDEQAVLAALGLASERRPR